LTAAAGSTVTARVNVAGIRSDPAAALGEGSSDNVLISTLTVALGASTTACKDFVADELLQPVTLAGRAEIHALVSVPTVPPGSVLNVSLQIYEKATGKTTSLTQVPWLDNPLR
jgi:hypothetical protein